MPILPDTIQDLLDFMDAHGSSWHDHAAALGLSPAQADLVKDGAGVARDKFNAQIAAMNAARAATVEAHDAAAAVRAAFAEALKTIKAYALTRPDPGAVYALASIPPPAPGSPLPPPGMPTDLKATLLPDGSVNLKWRARSPKGPGTVWAVERRLPGDSGFSFCGSAGLRSFTDRSIPAGTVAVEYRIFGQRGRAVGAVCAPFTVQFGSARGTGERPIRTPSAADGGQRSPGRAAA